MTKALVDAVQEAYQRVLSQQQQQQQHRSHTPEVKTHLAHIDVPFDEASDVRSDRDGGVMTPQNVPPFKTASEHLPLFGGKSSRAEVDLYNAAEALCVHLSGVNYRTIAKQATRACDVVARMIHEELSLAKNSGWVPSYLVARQADRLRGLFEESKQLLISNGISVPPTLERITQQDRGESYGEAAARGGSANNRQRSVSVDAAAAGGGKGSRNRDGSITPSTRSNSGVGAVLQPAPEEVYDVRLMHTAFDDQTSSHVRELEDEIIVLRTKLERVQREKKELVGVVERQDAQLVNLRSKLTKDTEALYHTQRQMEADLRQLALQTGHTELVTMDNEAEIDEGAPQPQHPAPPAQRPSAHVPAAQLVAMHPVAHKDSEDDELRTPTNISAIGTQANRHDAAADDESTMRSFNSNNNASRYNKLDAVYTDIYKGKGMEFLIAAIELVFKFEYDTAHVGGGGVNDTISHEVDAQQLRAAYDSFLRDLQSDVLATIQSFEAFTETVSSVTPLRSEYIANCVQHRCKPNSGIVRLLSTIGKDRDVEVLNLTGNYIGDGGVAPLLSILPRLYRLHTLRLADNGIKNTGVKILCQALHKHTSLSSLDLSKNNLTRAAGRELLSLAATMPRLRHIFLDGTHIDQPLLDKIEGRLVINREGDDSTSGPRGAKSPGASSRAETV